MDCGKKGYAMNKFKYNKINNVLSDNLFIAFTWTILCILFILLIYPLLFIVASSFRGGAVTMSMSLIPNPFSIVGYEAVFSYSAIWKGYLNTLIYTVVGTATSLVVTICCAYPLSRERLRFGGVVMVLCLITMYFSGGMIPSYLNMRNLGMLDSMWALVLPGSLSVYNMIIVRTFFKTQIPRELQESSQLDGCGDLRYLLMIVLPLSIPVISVIALYTSVNLWNAYFSPLIYLETRNKYPLSMILREILVINTIDLSANVDVDQMVTLQKRKETMKYAVIIISSLPVLMIYPFIQRYFVKGVMIGAIKG